MIILPATTPVAAADFSQLNQSQQNQISQSEHSRRATDTVQLSAQARQLAGPQQQNSAQVNTNTQAAPTNKEAAEKVADNEAIERQRPVNPQTMRPETNKINVLA